jgi:hypothetical protein
MAGHKQPWQGGPSSPLSPSFVGCVQQQQPNTRPSFPPACIIPAARGSIVRRPIERVQIEAQNNNLTRVDSQNMANALLTSPPLLKCLAWVVCFVWREREEERERERHHGRRRHGRKERRANTRPTTLFGTRLGCLHFSLALLPLLSVVDSRVTPFRTKPFGRRYRDHGQCGRFCRATIF